MSKEKELKRYLAVEEAFFARITQDFSDEIVLYCITGSLGRKDIIAGWSDIDILLVVRNYSAGLFASVLKAIEANDSGIKIGLTLYSVSEFNSGLFKDPKTYHSLKLIHDGIFTPRIFKREKIQLTTPEKSMIETFDSIDFTKVLHELKRELLKGEWFDETKTYKYITLLLKILLRRRGIYCLGYRHTFNEALRSLKGFSFKFSSPEEILTSPNLKERRYQTYIAFLNWLKEIG